MSLPSPADTLPATPAHPDPPLDPPRAPGEGNLRQRASSVAPRLAFESALIVLSVLLGLALNEWGEARREQAREAEMVANFRREITQNLAALQRAIPLHRAMAARLDSAATHPVRPGETAFDAFAALMPDSGLDIKPLRDAAWETAVSTGSLRLLPYDQAAALSETYLIQRQSIAATIDRLSDRFLMPQNFDPAARASMLRTHQMMMVELSGQETYLVENYSSVLKKLPRR